MRYRSSIVHLPSSPDNDCNWYQWPLMCSVSPRNVSIPCSFFIQFETYISACEIVSALSTPHHYKIQKITSNCCWIRMSMIIFSPNCIIIIFSICYSIERLLFHTYTYVSFSLIFCSTSILHSCSRLAVFGWMLYIYSV